MSLNDSIRLYSMDIAWRINFILGSLLWLVFDMGALERANVLDIAG